MLLRRSVDRLEAGAVVALRGTGHLLAPVVARQARLREDDEVAARLRRLLDQSQVRLEVGGDVQVPDVDLRGGDGEALHQSSSEREASRATTTTLSP